MTVIARGGTSEPPGIGSPVPVPRGEDFAVSDLLEAVRSLGFEAEA